MNKRIASVVAGLALVGALGLSGCGSDAKDEPADKAANSQSKDKGGDEGGASDGKKMTPQQEKIFLATVGKALDGKASDDEAVAAGNEICADPNGDQPAQVDKVAKDLGVDKASAAAIVGAAKGSCQAA